MPGLLVSGGKEGSLAEGVGAQSGYPVSPLHSGSRFTGHQQSKGNKYRVEVEFKVWLFFFLVWSAVASNVSLQHVDMENSTICGYLKIHGLTEVRTCLDT